MNPNSVIPLNEQAVGSESGMYAVLLQQRPYLRPAYYLAMLLMEHCEESEEMYWLVRALLMWVERKGCLQDVGPILMWSQHLIGIQARRRLVPKSGCTERQAEQVQNLLTILTRTIRGEVAYAA